MFLENILERIYGQIEKAEVIMAEITGHKPNVLYEVGYAHGMGKPVILVTSDAEEIPFDLKHYPHVVYGGQIRTLKSELEKKIRWCSEHPELLRSPTFRLSTANELDQIDQEVSSYLKKNHYARASFSRLEKMMGVSDELLRSLIRRRPDKFCYSLLKGDKPGIALI